MIFAGLVQRVCLTIALASLAALAGCDVQSADAANTGKRAAGAPPPFLWPKGHGQGGLGQFACDTCSPRCLADLAQTPGGRTPDSHIRQLHIARVRVGEVEQLLDSGNWLLVDVRPHLDLALTGTIPGAVHLPYRHEGAVPSSAGELSDAKLARLLHTYDGVIFFGNGSRSPRSYNAAVAAVQQWGVPPQRVVWFRDGMSAWRRSLPVPPLAPEDDP